MQYVLRPPGDQKLAEDATPDFTVGDLLQPGVEHAEKMHVLCVMGLVDKYAAPFKQPLFGPEVIVQASEQLVSGGAETRTGRFVNIVVRYLVDRLVA